MPEVRSRADRPRVVLSPITRDVAVAKGWLERGTSGWGGLDGVVAKRLDLPYQSGQRTGMQKIKRLRTADCVVGGFRYASRKRVVGSLLLGLYDADGLLDHVGFTSALSAAERAALTPRLERLIRPPGFTGRAPGGPSRWSTRRSDEWEPLEPKLVVEVRYDHFSDGRFRTAHRSCGGGRARRRDSARSIRSSRPGGHRWSCWRLRGRAVVGSQGSNPVSSCPRVVASRPTTRAFPLCCAPILHSATSRTLAKRREIWRHGRNRVDERPVAGVMGARRASEWRARCVGGSAARCDRGGAARAAA
jgi:ATP dependent DNA ligase-like protein